MPLLESGDLGCTTQALQNLAGVSALFALSHQSSGNF
jgi:hypothetical protein